MAGDLYAAGVRRPGAGGNQDAARDSGGKRAEETHGQAGDGLRSSGGGPPAGIRPGAPAADAGGALGSGAVGTSSTLTYRPAVDTGGVRAGPTDRTSEADSRHPAEIELAQRAGPARRALAIWILTAIIVTIISWTAVTVLARGSHAGRGVRD
jgi:hypothetical protein